MSENTQTESHPAKHETLVRSFTSVITDDGLDLTYEVTRKVGHVETHRKLVIYIERDTAASESFVRSVRHTIARTNKHRREFTQDVFRWSSEKPHVYGHSFRGYARSADIGRQGSKTEHEEHNIPLKVLFDGAAVKAAIAVSAKSGDDLSLIAFLSRYLPEELGLNLAD